MPIIINPGSGNKGGTIEQAKVIANKWLSNIHEAGITDVVIGAVTPQDDGMFLFEFLHTVTGKSVYLKTHGFTFAQSRHFRLHPRIYWNGSSVADPKPEDWLTDDYKIKVDFVKK